MSIRYRVSAIFHKLFTFVPLQMSDLGSRFYQFSIPSLEFDKFFQYESDHAFASLFSMPKNSWLDSNDL